MTECVECGDTENIDQHHTSYEPEKTVPLCRSCHRQVHEDESHELHPDGSPDKHSIAVTEEIKDRLEARKRSEYEPHYSVVGRLLDDSQTPAEQIADEIRETLQSEDSDVVLNEDSVENIRGATDE